MAQLVAQVFEIWRSLFVAGDYATAGLLADRILDLARREGSPESFVFVCNAQVSGSLFRGDLVGAEEHFARWNVFRDAADFRRIPGVAVAAISINSFCALVLGHSDLARERIAQTIAFARNSNNPYEMAAALSLEGWLYILMKEARRAEVAAERALAIIEEHGFPFLKNLALIALGRARAQLGRTGEGVALVRQGLAGFADTGNRLSLQDHLKWLAEAQALDGKIDDALITIEEALQANPEELVYRPNALTFRGELRLKVGQTVLAEADVLGPSALAEADFREAIGLAQKMQAKAWELRATISLTRLLRDTRRRDEARTMLASIYNWFTEGFDTADLIDAKALLDELSA